MKSADSKYNDRIIQKILYACLEGASRNLLATTLKIKNEVLGDILANLVFSGYLRETKCPCVNRVVYVTTFSGKENLSRLIVDEAWGRG